MVYKWLDSALDYGITEEQFWNSTLAELIRAIESIKRKQKQQAQEKAYSDYTLANMIGHSIARIHSNSAEYPHISAFYPALFNAQVVEEQQQQKKDELSALRFKQFASSFNKNFKKKEVGKEI